ncbi:hypothetical protein [Micromonospora sp. LOL_021]|uniref:hypothetical protein n=1 Tax=Micromonospora sp. LOL_021 TaxID=3345417 RepID=UPI003A83E86C
MRVAVRHQPGQLQHRPHPAGLARVPPVEDDQRPQHRPARRGDVTGAAFAEPRRRQMLGDVEPRLAHRLRHDGVTGVKHGVDRTGRGGVDLAGGDQPARPADPVIPVHHQDPPWIADRLRHPTPDSDSQLAEPDR